MLERVYNRLHVNRHSHMQVGLSNTHSEDNDMGKE